MKDLSKSEISLILKTVDDPYERMYRIIMGIIYGVDIDNRITHDAIKNLLDFMLDSIPELNSRVFKYKVVDRYSYDEISLLINKSRNASMYTFARSVTLLKNIIERYIKGEDLTKDMIFNASMEELNELYIYRCSFKLSLPRQINYYTKYVIAKSAEDAENALHRKYCKSKNDVISGLTVTELSIEEDLILD